MKGAQTRPKAYIALTRGEGYAMLEGDVWEGEGRCGAGWEMRGAKVRGFEVLYRVLWGSSSRDMIRRKRGNEAWCRDAGMPGQGSTSARALGQICGW